MMAIAFGLLHFYFDGEEHVCFSLDAGKSFLAGEIFVGEPERITWLIDVKCLNAKAVPRPNETPEDAKEAHENVEFMALEGCHLEIRGLEFAIPSWKELEGQSLAIKFNAEDVHPILPDNPANLYYRTEHHVPERNEIKFGKRIGTLFDITWKFEPERFKGDSGEEGMLVAQLPLREIQVRFTDSQSVSFDAASKCASRFVAASDLETPTLMHSKWVRVPVKDDAGQGGG